MDNLDEETTEQETLNPLANSLIRDLNGNGVIEIAAFGDSLTRGVGDFNAVGSFVEEVETPSREAGYPLRVESFLGLPVSNLGNPGERLSTNGLRRFADEVLRGSFDVVVLSGGSNDAIEIIEEEKYFRSAQIMINFAKALGIEVVLATIPPVCCDRAGLQPYITSYNNQLRELASVNNLPLADIDTAYRNSCLPTRCILLNIPEGLHPNIRGHDISGETVTATLLNIDILAPEGPSLLETALGLVPGSIRTIPNAPPATAAP